ncbi:sigma-70 family RNA polymerase sigma factor [Kibdelosporangium philippinense]|uniref:Sigma-70 family RNA polymerase sigma factor n=1 Tax=Kibdelosporangium philippinense TaxID=211113 RepID=A0ABS8Z156_9PSEU|nr:sigma-70 family RNA polymerase sigma factor [Kibdelosporangium philippinense]MCE7001500.1 sigma-70 family RNA polymerase sigma factor [Kibdelosporangium philippinense]
MTTKHEDLLRQLAPQVLGVLVRKYAQFDACEDAVQEALLAASVQWNEVPDNPKAWLITVASRRLTDQWRSEQARRKRETLAVTQEPSTPSETQDQDDTLKLLFLCCHPDLSPSSQVALTLRAVGGLTTGQIATAFMVPEPTMGQRISRAKQKIKDIPEPEWTERLPVVLHVLYLIFNEGYTASSGPDLQSVELTSEAIRLTRTVHALTNDGEVAGLLALMLLTDARRKARTGPDGELIPLAEQDRELWNQQEIAEGTKLIDDAMAQHPIGPYQLQAAIAALHDEAKSPEDTDWPQILVLYKILSRMQPNPMVTLNHAIALSMVDGPDEALAMLATLDGDTRLSKHHRLDAVKAHLNEMAGDLDAAHAAYLRAAKRTSSIPEQRYLSAKAANCLSKSAVLKGSSNQNK